MGVSRVCAREYGNEVGYSGNVGGYRDGSLSGDIAGSGWGM